MAREGKAPAFQWYARDFIAGTHGCNLEERGAIALLRSLQWEHGPLAGDDRSLQRDLGVSRAKLVQLLPVIGRFFVRDEQGRLLEQDIEDQRRAQQEYRAAQSDKGKASAAAKAAKTHDPPATTVDRRLPPGTVPVSTGLQPAVNSASCILPSAVEEKEINAGAGACVTLEIVAATWDRITDCHLPDDSGLDALTDRLDALHRAKGQAQAALAFVDAAITAYARLVCAWERKGFTPNVSPQKMIEVLATVQRILAGKLDPDKEPLPRACGKNRTPAPPATTGAATEVYVPNRPVDACAPPPEFFALMRRRIAPDDTGRIGNVMATVLGGAT